MTDISMLTPLSTCRKVQMETLESIRASLIPGEWVSCQKHTFSSPSSKLEEVPDTVLRVDNKSGEVQPQPTQVFPFVGYEFHLDLALVIPLREMAQFSGFDPTLKVKYVFDFRMFDVANWVACLNGKNGPGGTPSLEAPFVEALLFVFMSSFPSTTLLSLLNINLIMCWF